MPPSVSPFDFRALNSERPDAAAQRKSYGVRPSFSQGNAATTEQLLLLRAACGQYQPFYVADFTGALVFANAAFDQIAAPLFGITAETERSTETPAALLAVIERVRASQRTIETAETVELASAVRSYVGRHFPVIGDNGAPIGFGGFYTDVTPLDQAVQRANQMEAWLQDVIRSSSDWVWSTDVNLNLTYVSSRISEALGLPPQVLKGRYLLSLGHFESDKADMAKELLRRRAPFRHAAFIMADDAGNERRIQLSGVPVFHEATGKFLGYRGTGTDVTREHRAENLARQSTDRLEKTLEVLQARNIQLDQALTEARAAERAKMEFLAMMSHELRTPLNAIIGFSEVASQKVLGPLSDTYLGYFKDIHKAGRHLLGIINDILDTASIENQTLSVDVAPVRAGELAGEARALVALRAAEKQLDIGGVEIEDRWTIMADRLRTRQILVNLLNNAVKFTPEGGRIGIEAKQVGSSLALTVWDTGIGIPEDQQAKVFERFYQVKSADILSRNNEGTGLGLSVSRHLAQLMGGDLTLESTPGQGSRFTLTLPLAEPAAEGSA
jgi:PAS domain S-box-containing protein